jgi:hypothetical protein
MVGRVAAQVTTTHRQVQGQQIRVIVAQLVLVLPLVKVAAVQVLQAHQVFCRLAVMVATVLQFLLLVHQLLTLVAVAVQQAQAQEQAQQVQAVRVVAVQVCQPLTGRARQAQLIRVAAVAVAVTAVQHRVVLAVVA